MAFVKPRISQAEFKELFHYDPETGIFSHTKDKRCGVKKGDRAGYLNKVLGYQYLNVKNNGYPAHRMAWYYMTGEWPEHVIDHIKGDRVDNRWENLRHVTHRANSSNRRSRKSSKYGVRNVHWSNCHERWVVKFKLDTGKDFVRYFEDFSDAANCANDKRLELYGDLVVNQVETEPCTWPFGGYE